LCREVDLERFGVWCLRLGSTGTGIGVLEHWYFTTWCFTSVLIEEPGKVQITQILDVGEAWIA